MPNSISRHSIAALSLAALSLIVLLGGCSADNYRTGWFRNGLNDQAPSSASPSTDSAGGESRNLPSFMVTDEPPPGVIYRRGSRDTVLSDADAARGRMPSFSTQHVETLVTRKVAEIGRDLTQLGRSVANYQDRLETLQTRSDADASAYYALVASVNTELQSGTTAGNPLLIERWNASQDKLNTLVESTGHLNELAADIANDASRAAFLQESVRAAYGLSGAVKEDHQKLQVMEDGVNQNIVEINRLLTSVNDEINRRESYLRAERLNLQTLALAIANGELYGQSIANNLFKKATENGRDLYSAGGVVKGTASSSRRPLVIIRFDRPNVSYEQAVYTAVSQALEKFPAAKFDLVAVSPSEGNPAQIALASTEARKNGESVLRSLTQMGLPMERVRLNAANSTGVTGSEVHLYIQ